MTPTFWLERALARAAAEVPGAPIDKVQIQFKGPQPTVDVFLGKPTGGEDRRPGSSST